MKTFWKIALLCTLIFSMAACEEKTKPKPKLDTAAALAGYWDAQTNLTDGMYSQSQTLDAIEASILGLGSSKTEDPFAEWGALVEQFMQQSAAVADYFLALETLENNIVPYGEDKGLFGSIARGLYRKAADTVISGGRMVRSGYRVLTGKQSLRQVLRDPESGIPFVSSFAAKVHKHNADRDAAIRYTILNNDNQEDMVPISSLPGNTLEEKANYYLNLSEEDPIKMEMRAAVSLWDPDERIRTAATAVELGKVGVRAVGDGYGGGVGEWTNEVMQQHLDENQAPTDKGKLDVKIQSANSGNPPIEKPKTVIIERVDMPEHDPRITVIVDPPAEFEQNLPSGVYNVIAMAKDYIRNVESSLIVVKNSVVEQYNQLLELAQNAIVIESITAAEATVTVGNTAYVNLACLSSIGQKLNFNWSITGGDFKQKKVDKNKLNFVPTSEGRFEISCEVSDGLGNSKIASIFIDAIEAKISFEDYEISQEGFRDDKLNPGENATINFSIKNDSATDLSGFAAMEAVDGVGLSFNAQNLSIPAGGSHSFSAQLQIPANYTKTQLQLDFIYLVNDQANNSVLLVAPIVLPVDFYVELDPIVSPVTDRVLRISGRVANPSLNHAFLVLDDDFDQMYELSLTNGRFNQNVIVGASAQEVQHTVELMAFTGNIAATDTAYFTSQVLPNLMRITLTWDTDNTDVDLWVTDPNGERCYYGNKTTASGLNLDVDHLYGYGPENVTTSTIIPGNYHVQVHYYSDHDWENAIGTNASVVIRINEGSPEEEVYYYYGYLNDSGDLWNVTTLTFNLDRWTLQENNVFEKVDPATLPQK